MPLEQRKLPSTLILTVLAPASAWFIFRPLIEPIPALQALYTSIGFSIAAGIITAYIIPHLGPSFVKAGLKGKDLLKVDKTDMSVRVSLL